MPWALGNVIVERRRRKSRSRKKNEEKDIENQVDNCIKKTKMEMERIIEKEERENHEMNKWRKRKCV